MNPFSELKGKEKAPEWEEWGGQFSCQHYPCYGYAKVAKYFRGQRMLVWECEEGHRSFIDDIDE